MGFSMSLPEPYYQPGGMYPGLHQQLLFKYDVLLIEDIIFDKKLL
jgi:hypothetical protein